MRVCPKCGSRIDDNAAKCPVCEEISELDRRSYKRNSNILYYTALIITSVYAIVCAFKGMDNFTRLKSQILHMDHSILGMVRNDRTVTAVYSVLVDLLPLMLIIFIVALTAKGRCDLLLPFPVAGIAAEIAQIVKGYPNYSYILREKVSFYYGIMAMDIFSALLVIIFFALMIRMILKDYTISQSRMLVAFGFVLVASRVILKLCMAGDAEILRFVSDTKSYLLLSAILLNVKKRFVNSKNM
jgi:predicted nucleic acid-binding Zn ribbon protein